MSRFVCKRCFRTEEEYEVAGEEGSRFLSEIVCGSCRADIPESLLKACVDNPFDYVLGLKDGTVIRFSGADIKGNWVTIERGEWGKSDALLFGYPMERGVDIRLDQIVWCADAPEGS